MAACSGFRARRSRTKSPKTCWILLGSLSHLSSLLFTTNLKIKCSHPFEGLHDWPLSASDGQLAPAGRSHEKPRFGCFKHLQTTSIASGSLGIAMPAAARPQGGRVMFAWCRCCFSGERLIHAPKRVKPHNVTSCEVLCFCRTPGSTPNAQSEIPKMPWSPFVHWVRMTRAPNRGVDAAPLCFFTRAEGDHGLGVQEPYERRKGMEGLKGVTFALVRVCEVKVPRCEKLFAVPFKGWQKSNMAPLNFLERRGGQTRRGRPGLTPQCPQLPRGLPSLRSQKTEK